MVSCVRACVCAGVGMPPAEAVYIRAAERGGYSQRRQRQTL